MGYGSHASYTKLNEGNQFHRYHRSGKKEGLNDSVQAAMVSSDLRNHELQSSPVAKSINQVFVGPENLNMGD
jgi:hypothetical protein